MFDIKVINSFCFLSDVIKDYLNKNESIYTKDFHGIIKKTEMLNPWFQKKEIKKSLAAIATMIENNKINNWLSHYSITSNRIKNIGVIMPGNIPLAGFHDFLCVLCSGHIFQGKLSSADKYLLPFLSDLIIKFSPSLKNKIFFTKNRLKKFDAIIATGSNNTSYYFQYYFRNKPNIIRKNRGSVAVINGNETEEELDLLSNDVFQYFGLGCRSISKLYIPQNYDLDTLFKAFYKYKNIVFHSKYANNYNYNRSMFLMSNSIIIENGFIMLKEDKLISSPIAVLHYEYYTNINKLKRHLMDNKEDIQCVVSKITEIKNSIKPGNAQNPLLDEYADGVDTMMFLSSL